MRTVEILSSMTLSSVCQSTQSNYIQRKLNLVQTKNFCKKATIHVFKLVEKEFTLSHVSFLFQIPKATLSSVLLLKQIFLYFSLGSILLGPTGEQINQKMPGIFKIAYPSTQWILDCTKLYCQRRFSYSTHSSLYLHSKSHVTYVGLICVSPSGLIIFVNELYNGSISDNETARKPGILEK